MRVSPDTMTRVASSETTTMRLDSDVVVDTVTLHDCLGIVRGLPVTDNTVTMPPLPAPDLCQLDWLVGGVTLFTTYCEIVSRHYFRLDDLRAYGDAQDDFDKMDEESLYLARQAATEIFELNAHRSFVRRIGSTKDYGHETLLNLAHTDVYKMMTEGYTLVSDCQVARRALWALRTRVCSSTSMGPTRCPHRSRVLCLSLPRTCCDRRTDR